MEEEGGRGGERKIREDELGGRVGGDPGGGYHWGRELHGGAGAREMRGGCVFQELSPQGRVGEAGSGGKTRRRRKQKQKPQRKP